MGQLALAQEFLAPHFLCFESGLVFYGDSEWLDVCRHVEEDVSNLQGEEICKRLKAEQ